MRLAILGATSQIAKDLTQSFAKSSKHCLALFARRPEAVVTWLNSLGIDQKWDVAGYESFSASQNFDVVINFIGVGNPVQTAVIGASIFDITLQYDELVLRYLKEHPSCRYIFLSSGAAYSSTFDEPATKNTVARIPINNLQPQDWYGVAKLYAECRHRALANLAIVDIRVFNYFSHTQDMEAQFMITDIVRAIRDKVVLNTSPDYMVRDFIGPDDFYRLVNAILSSPATNDVVDCYTKAPIDKPSLLAAMQAKFGLKYKIVESAACVNATGSKPHYYSLNQWASNFGYRPALTSLEGVLGEASAMFKYQTSKTIKGRN